MADIILLTASVRRPFRESELALLERCVREDQRVLFVLTQADLERDSTESGRVVRSRADRLRGHRDALVTALEAVPGLSSYGMATISAKQAQHAAGDRTSAAWRESQFEQILGYLDAFRADLANMLAASRARALVPILDRCREETRQLRDQGDGGSPIRELIERREAQAEELTDAVEEVGVSIGFEYESWKGQLDPDGWETELRDAIAGFSDRRVDDFQAAIDERRRNWHNLREGLLAGLMEAEAEMAQALATVDLAPDYRGDRHRRPSDDGFPSLDPFVWTSTEVYEVDQPRSWMEGGVLVDWLRGRKQERRERMIAHLNVPALMAEVHTYLQRTAGEIAQHLEWWKRHTTTAYLDVLREGAEGEANALNDLRRQAEAEDRERAAAIEALNVLTQTVTWIRRARDLPVPTPSAPTARATSGTTRAVGPTTRSRLAGLALQPLLSATWDASFARLWRRHLDLLAPHAERPRVLLLGAHRANHIALAAALTHRLDELAAWCSTDPRTWLWIGREPDATLPGPASALAEGGAWDVVIAPADAELPTTPWTGLLGTFDAVGIECDAPRISCGLKDLHAAPYRDAAASLERRVFLCSGDAGMFADRLHELAGQVLPLADERAPFASPRPWFLYETESYDARATVIAQARRDGLMADLSEQWEALGLSWAPPFSRERLADLAASDRRRIAVAG